VPFGSLNESYTTSLIFDEIKHIKKSHDALDVLFEAGRLKIIDPDKEYVDMVISKAKKTGDLNQLSKQDVSVVALCLQLKGELVTDDFAVSNIAKNLDLNVSAIMTSGIKDVGNWIHYCPGCHKNFPTGIECPLCGNPLKKKLLKQQAET